MYNPIPKSLALTNISEFKKNVCVCLGQLCAYNSCQAQYVIISLEGGGTWTKKHVYNCQADQPTNYGHQTATFECGTPSSGHLQRSLAHHSSRNTCKQSTTECNPDTIEEDQDRRKRPRFGLGGQNLFNSLSRLLFCTERFE